MEQKWNKKLVIFGMLLLVILVPSVLGVRINEVELNPEGTDGGNEWVELYSKEEINLTGWKLVNNDEDEIFLDESFSDYLIVNFDSQWLDNEDEKVFLYDDEDNLIDETVILEDTKNNNLSWSFCEGWEFVETTEEAENSCAGGGEEETEEDCDEDEVWDEDEQECIDVEDSCDEDEVWDEDEQECIDVEDSCDEDEVWDEDEEKCVDKKEEEQQTEQQPTPTPKKETSEEQQMITSQVIKLVPKKSELEKGNIYKAKNEYIKEYIIYGFTLFLAFIVIILVLKKMQK